MKLRSFKYGVIEGFLNVFKNKLMSVASIVIVGASLFILGIFYILSVNINYNVEILQSTPEIQAFLNTALSDAQVKQIEKKIATMDKVLDYRIISKEEALEIAKGMLGDKSNLLEGLEKENPLPVSFVIRIKNPKDGGSVVDEVKSISGVENVKYAFDLAMTLSKFAGTIRLVSTILILILAAIAVFIISNTIKLTVFARRREISIMKYVGATDTFIRWPFIVEGIVIGIFGSALCFIAIYFLYDYGASYIQQSMSMIKIKSFVQLGSELAIAYALIGSVMGAAGSYISIRKYLRV